MTQIRPSVTNPTISDIYERIQSDRLDLQPDFQRRFVWTFEHQEKFIETILKGYPFPEIYVCTGDYNESTMSTSQRVIDGQQRLTTIRNYINGYSSNPKDEFKIIKPFNELTKEEKKQFMSYQLVVRDIGDVEDEVVREIFKRINLTKFKLEDIEIHNAVYDGDFIQTAKDVLESIKNKYSDVFNIFYESELTRMADLYFLLQIMSTFESRGYYSLDKELEKNIAKYNESYENRKFIETSLDIVFNLIYNMKLGEDSIWFRKSNFFTLVVELLFAIEENNDLTRNNIKDKLITFEENIIKNRNTQNEYGIYYGSMYSGTNSRKSRVTRSTLFKKYVLDIQEKDQ